MHIYAYIYIIHINKYIYICLYVYVYIHPLCLGLHYAMDDHKTYTIIYHVLTMAHTLPRTMIFSRVMMGISWGFHQQEWGCFTTRTMIWGYSGMQPKNMRYIEEIGHAEMVDTADTPIISNLSQKISRQPDDKP